jgi:predicted outer membrane protein
MVAAALLVFGISLGPSRALGQADVAGPANLAELNNPLLAPPEQDFNPALMSVLDDEFIDQTVGRNNAIVAFSKLATRQTATDSVRTFARQMAADHAVLGDKLAKLADLANVRPLLWLNRVDEREYKKLQSLSGSDFDSRYLRDMRSFDSALIELFDQRRCYTINWDIQEFIDKNATAVKTEIREVKVHLTAP